jgi:uncharacterized protein (TIGR02996 family)
MHPEGDALLDAIFADPDDDTPRLVYADWLQEHDQENYAQFIRLQCAAARHPFWTPQANDLWEQIGRVWARLSDEWWEPAHDDWRWIRHGNLDAIHFHRGFLRDSVPLSFSQLVRYGRTCWPWLPLPVTNIVPDYAGEKEVATLPRLSRVRHLRPAGWRDDEDIWTLIDSPLLCNLEVLDMMGGMVVEGEVECMLKPGMYPSLREVRLRVFDEQQHFATCLDGSAPLPTETDFMARIRRTLEARFERVVLRTAV